MIDNATLVSPFIVAVLEDYFNERPENVLVNITKLPVEHGYRRAVVDALNGNNYVNVSYETLQSIDDNSVFVSIGEVKGSVTLHEDGNVDYDGYTLPEDWTEEDLAEHEAAKNAPDPHGIDLRTRQWIAKMYHGPVSDYNATFLANRFNTTPEVIEEIAKEFPAQPEENPLDLLNGLMGTFL